MRIQCRPAPLSAILGMAGLVFQMQGCMSRTNNESKESAARLPAGGLHANPCHDRERASKKLFLLPRGKKQGGAKFEAFLKGLLSMEKAYLEAKDLLSERKLSR